jgi:branched-chain amino acid transport system ATP-binding protein
LAECWLATQCQLRTQGTAVLLVEQLLEKALAAADRVYALVQGHIVLQAPTSEANLPQRLEHAYFGHEVQGSIHAQTVHQ